MKQELFYYQNLLKKPIFIQRKALTFREGLILKIQNKDGAIGYGDICPLPFLSNESLKQAYEQLKKIDYSRLDKLYPHKLFPSVSFGIQSAMTPFAVKSLSIPYCSLYTGTFNEILSQIETSKANIIKIKISKLTDVETIKVLQVALQKKKIIRIDCNRKWSYTKALDILSLFSSKDFEYIEEPCRTKKETLDLANKTDFPIALDESIYGLLPSEIEPIKKIVFKPSAYHLLSWMRKKPVVYSSSFESGLGLSHLLSLSYQTSQEIPGVDTYRYLKEDILQAPLSFNESVVTIKEPVLNMDRLCPISLI